MRKELKKGDIEYDMFNDYWQICKEYNIPEDTEDYWTKLIDSGNEFCRKYDWQYARDIMFAYINSRETIYKNLKKP